MTKQEILEYFKDINHAYNESTRLDDLSLMLDELMQSNSDEDCISRKSLLEEIENGIKAGNYEEGYEEYPHINDMDDIIECIKYADSVKPKPKTGHWIEDDMTYCGVELVNYKCDKCGEMGGAWRRVSAYRY